MAKICGKTGRMPVKDLVGLYESRAVAPTPPSSTRAGQDRRPSQSESVLTSQTAKPTSSQHVLDIPSTPARFITHPLLRRREPSTADQEDDPILPDPASSDVSHATYTPLSTRDDDDKLRKHVGDADVTDELLSVSGRNQNTSSRGESRLPGSGWVKGAVAEGESSAFEMKALLPGYTESSHTASPQARRDLVYEAETNSVTSISTVYKNPPLSSSTVTLVQPPRTLGPHIPIPLGQILDRSAAPVALPKLDEYISSLEMPHFPVFHTASKGKGKGKSSTVAMFPPLEQLQGTTIVDLENNAKIAPAWRNRDTIFSSLLNVALSVTVGPVVVVRDEQEHLTT